MAFPLISNAVFRCFFMVMKPSVDYTAVGFGCLKRNIRFLFQQYCTGLVSGKSSGDRGSAYTCADYSDINIALLCRHIRTSIKHHPTWELPEVEGSRTALPHRPYWKNQCRSNFDFQLFLMPLTVNPSGWDYSRPGRDGGSGRVQNRPEQPVCNRYGCRHW